MMDERSTGNITRADQSQSLNEREREREREGDLDMAHYLHVCTPRSSESSEPADVGFSDIESSANTLFKSYLHTGPS